MRSKLKEIDSLCDAAIKCTYRQENEAAATRIKAIVADLLSEDWDCTLQAFEVIQYREALEAAVNKILGGRVGYEDRTLTDIENLIVAALKEADRVRDGTPITVAKAKEICVPCTFGVHRDCAGHGCSCYIAGQVGPFPQEKS